ncbi:hypothetical protein ABTE84_20975, partial [Acinetobacter baumannii]
AIAAAGCCGLGAIKNFGRHWIFSLDFTRKADQQLCAASRRGTEQGHLYRVRYNRATYILNGSLAKMRCAIQSRTP